MEVVHTQLQPDIQFTKEKPQNIHVVVLPEVTIPSSGHRVKLSLHTDNVGNLLRFLYSLPEEEISSLLIEGRYLSQDQFNELSNHPLYRFYTSLRTTKVLISEALETFAFTYPKDSGIIPDEAKGLITRPFSPITLAKDLDYQTSYYNAYYLVQQWLQTGNTNNYLPMFGGCNEFAIGSDNLSEDQLKLIGNSISAYIADQQYISKRVPLRFLEQLSYIVSLRDHELILKTTPPRVTDFLEEAEKLNSVLAK
ncbi:hypothetical protein HYT02_02865 [Candidatus Gottesmanbacteria bacterium]|nr:hypothetical protein [Candidatus Gottesmanbacteria bacterium]